MVGPQVFQLDMTDGGGNPGGKVFVSDYGAMLCAPLLLQFNHIVTVFGELQPAVAGGSRSTLLLKGGGESLRLFSCALFRPGRRYLKGGRPGLELPPIRPPAPVDADGIGDQLAGLVPALLDVSHFSTPSSPRHWHHLSFYEPLYEV